MKAAPTALLMVSISAVSGPTAPEPATTATVITTPSGIRMVRIPEGTFVMGSPESEPGRDGDEIQHEVTLSRPFYLGVTEVTQGQWRAVMGENPSRFRACGDSCPVEMVSWRDAVIFCNRLSELEGLRAAYATEKTVTNWDATADGYRLPTEAEWEYACRAGTTSPFWTGDCLSTGQANYNGNHPLEGCPKGENRERTVVVGSFEPNAWGLHDMHGNVWEWCWDRYGPYPSTPVVDPSGPKWGSSRVLRGGGWHYHAFCSRSANRDDGGPDMHYIMVGFRLARSAF